MDDMQFQDFAVLIGKRLHELRKKNGLSQQELSYRTGIEKPSIRRLEKGRTNPTLKTLLKICTGLGITLPSLFQFEITAIANSPDSKEE